MTLTGTDNGKHLLSADREKEVLLKYSTRGLKRNQLDRAAKREHLERLHYSEKQVKETLDEIYGKEHAYPAVTHKC